MPTPWPLSVTCGGFVPSRRRFGSILFRLARHSVPFEHQFSGIRYILAYRNSRDLSYPTQSPHAADFFFRIPKGEYPWVASVDAGGKGFFFRVQRTVERQEGVGFRYGRGRTAMAELFQSAVKAFEQATAPFALLEGNEGRSAFARRRPELYESQRPAFILNLVEDRSIGRSTFGNFGEYSGICVAEISVKNDQTHVVIAGVGNELPGPTFWIPHTEPTDLGCLRVPGGNGVA